MNDGVQSTPGVRVVEDELAQARAIDPTVAHVVRAEFPHNSVKAGAAGFVRRMSRLVSVDHDGAKVFQHRGHRRLSGPDAACQPNEFQFA
jgi:hypothetical protein